MDWQSQRSCIAYADLANSPLINEAQIGLANVERWRGRDDRAYPLYQEVLKRDASNADAKEGLELHPRIGVPVLRCK